MTLSVRPILRAALVALAALAATGPAGAQNAFAPAAVVNDDVITVYDVGQRAALIGIGGGPTGGEAGAIALELLVDDMIRMQAGEREGLGASQAEIDGAIADFAAGVGATPAAVVARVDAAGVSREALYAQFAAELTWRKIVRRRFGARAEPTEAEIDAEIALSVSSGAISYRLSEISLVTPQGGDAATQERAQRLVAELRAGGDFAATARRVSRSPSASAGGDVGWIPASALPVNVVAAVQTLDAGEVSDPVPVPGGVSIFRLQASRSEAPPWARSATLTLLRVAATGARVDPTGALENARDLADGLDCAAPPATAEDVEVAAIGPISSSDLTTGVRNAIAGLVTGQVSAPVREGGDFAIYAVCGIEGGVSAEVREQLRAQLRNRRLTRMAEGYIQELRRDAVIELR